MSAAVPVSAPAREGTAQPTPRARTAPPLPSEDLVVTLALPHVFLSGTPRLQFSICLRGFGPRLAGAVGERP